MAERTNIALPQNEDADRAIKWVLFPILIFVVILMTIIEEWRLGGAVALALIAFSYLIFITPRFKNMIFGIPSNPFKGMAWGIGLFSLFFILNNIDSAFSIGVPTVPQAVSEFSLEGLGFSVGRSLTVAIIVIIFPFVETFYHISMITALMGFYRASFLVANFIQAIIFGSILHLLAYSIVLANASSFGVALQQIESVSGLLFSATLFGFLAGWIVFKIQNYLPVALAHSGINYSIVAIAFAIFQFA